MFNVSYNDMRSLLASSREDEEVAVTSDDEMKTTARLENSFGCCCQPQRNTIAAVPGNALVFVAGRYTHILYIDEGRLELRPNSRPLGCVVADSEGKLVAVGEAGERPRILVHTWPGMKVASELRDGAHTPYVDLDFRPDGEVLCSVSGSPEVTLTLWNWRQGQVLVSHSPSAGSVYRAIFSRAQTDTIVTVGESHIGFWRTAHTFTGLKISGEPGRFGSITSSDVTGFLNLEDGRVSSSCDWGNILLWSHGRVEREITTRRPGVTCHNKPVVAFHQLQPYLVSIGGDGWVRFWKITSDGDHSENNTDKPILSRQESVLYFRVAPKGCDLINKTQAADRQEVWFLQDSRGAIWRSEVKSALAALEKPEIGCILRCHSGSVAALACSPHDGRVASLGADGRLIVRHFLQVEGRAKVAVKECDLSGSALIWLPLHVDKSGSRLLVGFATGVLALYSVQPPLEGPIRELQALRPHSERVLCLEVGQSGTVLASGSEDCTICVLVVGKRPRLQLRPHVLLVTPHVPCRLLWSKQDTILLACCKNGVMAEFVLPPRHPKIPLLPRIDPSRLVSLNTATLPTSIPTIKVRVVAAEMENEGELALILTFSEGKPAACKMSVLSGNIVGAWEILPSPPESELTAALVTADGRTALLGFSCGSVQLTLLGDRKRFWRCQVHTSDVTALTLTFDFKHFFSCDQDGNEYMFALNMPRTKTGEYLLPSEEPLPNEKQIGLPAKNLNLTLEKMVLKKQQRRTKILVRNKKLALQAKIDELREKYSHYFERCKKEGVEPSRSEDLHEKLAQYLKSQLNTLQDTLLVEAQEQVKLCELEWQKMTKTFLSPLASDSLVVCAFGNDESKVSGYRLLKRSPEDSETLKHLENEVAEEEQRWKEIWEANEGRVRKVSEVQLTPEPEREIDDEPESSLFLERLRQHRNKRRQLTRKLAELDSQLPLPLVGLNDECLIQHAKISIGDFKLKSEERLPPKKSVLHIRHAILRLSQQIYELKLSFNNEIDKLRQRKRDLISSWNQLTFKNTELVEKESALDKIMHLKDPELKNLLELDSIIQRENKCDDMQNTEKEGIHLMSITSISEASGGFDNDIEKLVEKRAELDMRLALLELRILGLRREKEILQEFGTQEARLETRMAKERKMRDQFRCQLTEVAERLLEHKNNVVEFTRQLRQIEKTFQYELSGSEFYQTLRATFLSEFRPSRRTSSAGRQSSCDSLGTSSSGNFTPSSSRKSRGSTSGALIIPPGCDPALAERVHQFRVQRHEIKTNLEAEQGFMEQIKREEDVIVKKIKLVDKKIDEIRENMRQFLMERQKKVDALEEAVPLRMHQLPAGNVAIEECVLMEEGTLKHLRGRAQQLREETAQLEKQLETDRKRCAVLTIQCQRTETRSCETRKEIHQTMFERFGQLVDLEQMESTLLSSADDSRTGTAPRMSQDKRDHLEKLEKEVTRLKESVNHTAKVKAEKMKQLANLLKENNDRRETVPSRHEQCKRYSDLSLRVRQQREQLLAAREQTTSLRHELALLRCKVTSSRDIFPAPASPPSEDLQEDQGTGKYLSSGSSTAPPSLSPPPEIVVQPCEEEALLSDE